MPSKETQISFSYKDKLYTLERRGNGEFGIFGNGYTMLFKSNSTPPDKPKKEGFFTSLKKCLIDDSSIFLTILIFPFRLLALPFTLPFNLYKKNKKHKEQREVYDKKVASEKEGLINEAKKHLNVEMNKNLEQQTDISIPAKSNAVIDADDVDIDFDENAQRFIKDSDLLALQKQTEYRAKLAGLTEYLANITSGIQNDTTRSKYNDIDSIKKIVNDEKYGFITNDFLTNLQNLSTDEKDKIKADVDEVAYAYKAYNEVLSRIEQFDKSKDEYTRDLARVREKKINEEVLKDISRNRSISNRLVLLGLENYVNNIASQYYCNHAYTSKTITLKERKSIFDPISR